MPDCGANGEFYLSKAIPFRRKRLSLNPNIHSKENTLAAWIHTGLLFAWRKMENRRPLRQEGIVNECSRRDWTRINFHRRICSLNSPPEQNQKGQKGSIMISPECVTKLIPAGSLILRASDSRLHVYRVRAWSSSSEELFPVCLAYRAGRYFRISFFNVLPWHNRARKIRTGKLR